MKKYLLILIGLALQASALSLRAEVLVIAHPAVDLSLADVREVYLGEKQFYQTMKLVPVENPAVQKEFLEMVMKLNINVYSTVWTKKAFRDGLNAPPSKGSDLEVANFVRSTPGAVGYVSASAAGVKVLGKL